MEVTNMSYICSKSVFGFSRMKPAQCACHTLLKMKGAEKQ